MSTIPLRIDAELVNEARQSASVMDRTPTAQIEFWAKLGRVLEAVLSHDAVVLMKTAARVRDVDELLARANTPQGRQRALAEIARHKGPIYSSDPDRPGVIVETRSDGSKRRGRFVNRHFTPLSSGTLQ